MWSQRQPNIFAVMHNGEFADERLAQIYEVLCPWGRSDQFFLDIANELPQAKVLDLGCGTGQLTHRIAQSGHTVTGIEPALASLDIARGKPGAERVTWIHGLAKDAPTGEFDLALMTNHVAQFLTREDEWRETLGHLHRALKPAGLLVFDARDPVYRAWEHWNPDETRHEVKLQEGQQLVTWTEITAHEDENVTFVHHYLISDQTSELLSQSTLRFRSLDSIRATLDEAGFDIDQVYGGWNREAVGQGDGEFIVIARKRV